MISLHSALRQLARAPAFALIVTGFLGLSVAALLALWTAAYSMLWKPLPFAHGDRLVELRGYSQSMRFQLGYAVPLALDVHEFAEIEAAGMLRSEQGIEDAEGRPLAAVRVSAELLPMLGVAPLLGRLPTTDDGDDVALVSAEFWRSRLGADPLAVERTLELPGRRLHVIGVLPDDFSVPSRGTALWLPLHFSAEERAPQAVSNWGNVRVFARLAAGVPVERAEAAINARYLDIPELDSMREFMGLTVQVTALRELWTAERRRLLGELSLAAVLVMLTLAANLASLWLGRALARQDELALRQALGAGRVRAMAPLLTEIALLTVAGVGLGLLLTPPALRVLAAVGVVDPSSPLPLALDATTLGAAGLSAALLFVLLSLGPLWLAWRGFRSRGLGRSERSPGASAGGARARRVLVAFQVAVAVALLAGGGLLLRSLVELMQADQGFAASGFVMVELVPRDAEVAGTELSPAARIAAWYDGVATMPGVSASSFASAPPYSRSEVLSSFELTGQGREERARDRLVGPGYFAMIGQPLLMGRGFAEGDTATSAVVVDERFVALHLEGRDPLGAEVGVPVGQGVYQPARIVGVVRTAQHFAPDEPVETGSVYRQIASPADASMLARFVLLRVDAGLQGMRPRLEEWAGVHGLRLARVAGIEDWVRLSLAPRLPLLSLLVGFAVVCLLLCATGLFALVQFWVASRRGEFGVKLALGASPERLSREVVSGALRTVLPGLVLGLAAALAVGQLLAAQLFQVSAFDPLTLGSVLLVMLLAALAASWGPARGVRRVSPAQALRQE
jgi:predicted permease